MEQLSEIFKDLGLGSVFNQASAPARNYEKISTNVYKQKRPALNWLYGLKTAILDTFIRTTINMIKAETYFAMNTKVC